ncbi:MAG: helix-turn-helix domain-containing protein [Gammaproteobacteria bacterium]|nr:MAG: helix-turn-helix domain-containing protein [Gammaproteobacteria bacterium]
MTDAEERAGFGARLAEARKTRGMSLEDVHQHTRLEMRIIEALELERIDDLGQPVYARGYIRSYARLVGLDPQALIESYNAASGAPEVDSWAPPQVERHEAGQHIRPQYVALALVAIVTLLVLFWVFGKQDDSEGTVPTSAAPDKPTVTAANEASPLPALPEQSDAGTAATEDAPHSEGGVGSAEIAGQGPESTGGQAGGADETAPRAAVVPEPAQQAEPADTGRNEERASQPEAVPDGKVLTLQLEGDSWVEVIDARGRKLVRRLLRAGQVERLVGEPPFSVFLGNADAVRLKYEDQPVDPRRWRRPNATARFRIPE